MTQNTMLKKNLKILTNQLPIPHKFSISLISPRSSSNNDSDKQDEILVKVTLLRQLFEQYKREQVQLNEIFRILRQASFLLKRNQLTYRKFQLPKEIANINRIKQDNQRILQRRIKTLQEKLKKLGHDSRSQYQKLMQISENKVKTQEKDQEVTKLNNLLKKIQQQVLLRQQAQAKLFQQNMKLQQTIKKQQLLINEGFAKNFVQQKTIIYTHKQTQTSNKYLTKNTKLYSQTIYPQQQATKVQKIYQTKYHQLLNEFHAIDESNSVLRNKLLRLQTYMEEQDQKYQKNIQYLESKIKKLTEFNGRSRDSSLVNSTVNFTNPNSPILSQAKRKHRHNLTSSVNIGQHENFGQSRIIHLADLKIKFQLNKPDEGLNQTKLTSQQSKLSITSSQK